MKEITLTQGKVALVDDEDFEDLSKYKWYAQKIKNNFYAVRHLPRVNGKQMVEYMHRRILGLKPGDKRQGDHKFHNTLDNRREKLRNCMHGQNNSNSRKRKKCTSQFKGVCWDKYWKKWLAQIKVNCKRIFLGYFPSEIDAARAYDKAAIQYFGEFAYLNFPKEKVA